ncbi:hypothetical protein GE21DRAFT_1330290 [Neurospora crassa]|nr:hypothetical protein GE21DRAFT_1330290 [Neurospora crassa]
MTKVRSQLQQELAGLRSQVSDLLVQVDVIASEANKSVSTTNDGNEVATLRAKNADLRRLLSNMRSIESLQIDFDILKSRVQRLEGDQQTAKNLTSPNCHKRTSSEAELPETDIAGELPSTPAIDTSPCLARRRCTRRRTVGMQLDTSD